MATPYEDEAAPLISRAGIPTAVRDYRQSREKQLAVYLILASTFFERIAFYTLAANLALTLEPVEVGGKSSNSSITPFIFFGTSYISTIIFAIISDWKLGRAKTIIVGFCLYLIGYISAILITIPQIYGCIQYISRATCTGELTLNCYGCRVWFLVTLIIIAIGAGAVESNMAVLGAEQIQDSKITSRYFDKYMVAINIGGIVATLAFLFSSKLSNDNETRFLIPCIVAASALFVAALLFIIGYPYYIHLKSDETVITNCIPVVINAFQSWHKYEQNIRSKNKENTSSAGSTLLNASQSLTEEETRRIDERPSTFLDFAKVPNGKFHDRIVNDVKSLRGALIVFILLIPFWLIYNQLSSTFAIQAKYMSEYDDYKVTYMWLGDPVTIIIGILIFNLFVYKFLDARHRPLTIVTKFIIGMCLAVMCMCIAGTIEKYRQDGCNIDYGQNQSSLLIYYQLPQNIFMGFSEIFAMMASFEYAYFAAPRSAQTLFMSLRFCSLGVSSFIATAYFIGFSQTKSQMDFRCPSAEGTQWSFYTYFYILAGLQLIFIIIFIVCQKKFQIVKLNPQQMETNQFLQHSYASPTNRQ